MVSDSGQAQGQDPAGAADGWAHRRQSSVRAALRYSRFVGVMRHLLPTLALGILAVVLAYALYPRGSARMSLSYENVQKVDGDLAMQKPRLSGTDSQGNPYLITASSAVQDSVNSRRVSLHQVDADLQYDGGRWANAISGKGVVDLDAKQLTLSDGLSLFTDTGYELHTDNAFADLNRNIVVGKAKVHGQGPLGAFDAEGFLVDRQKQHLTLTGQVRMTFYPKKVKS